MSKTNRFTISFIVLLFSVKIASLFARAEEANCELGWHSPSYESLPSFCYKFSSVINNSWISAYSDCKNSESELIWFETSDEFLWVKSIIRDISSQDQRLIFVNAHRYLYDPLLPSWFNGEAINKLMFYQTSAIFNAQQCDKSLKVRECFGLNIGREEKGIISSIYCDQTSQLGITVCKKRSDCPKSDKNSNCVKASDCQNRQGWESNRNNCYRFLGPLDVSPFDEGKVSWADAFHYCKNLGAGLFWIEDQEESEYFREKLGDSDIYGSSTGWYINIHRFLNKHSTLSTDVKMFSSNENNGTEPLGDCGIYWNKPKFSIEPYPCTCRAENYIVCKVKLCSKLNTNASGCDETANSNENAQGVNRRESSADSQNSDGGITWHTNGIQISTSLLIVCILLLIPSLALNLYLLQKLRARMVKRALQNRPIPALPRISGNTEEAIYSKPNSEESSNHTDESTYVSLN